MTFQTPRLFLAVFLTLPVISSAQNCVVLKRMGPADQITSHMYSFGIRGKQFQYVEGQLPKGVKFHGRLTDHDVRQIQDAGVRFVILEPKFTGADLAEARKGCISNFAPDPVAPESPAAVPPAPVKQVTAAKPTEASRVQTGPVLSGESVKPKAAESPSSPDVTAQSKVTPAALSVVDHQPTIAPKNVEISSAEGTALESTASVTSDPEGAEIFVDSVGRGHAPIILKLPSGKHSIQLVLAGYKDWLSVVDLKPGDILNVTANLSNKP